MEQRRNKFLDINEHGKAVAQSFDENGNLVEEELNYYIGTNPEIFENMRKKTDEYAKTHTINEMIYPWG
jgi:hypothetical protein